MRERAEQVLRQWGVPRRYVGYTYLLDMAEMFPQEEICLPRFFGLVAQRRGKGCFQLRKGVGTVVKYLRATPQGQAWQRAHGAPLSHFDLIALLMDEAAQRP